ncbi:MAG: hypothetical protein V4629_04625 [Pseudomonadota bacterium]
MGIFRWVEEAVEQLSPNFNSKKSPSHQIESIQRQLERFEQRIGELEKMIETLEQNIHDKISHSK